MKELFVKYLSYCTESYREEEYGDWSESFNFSVEGVCLKQSENCNYEKFNTEFEVDVGDIIWVLYMVYSSGDSFGYGTGYGEVMWVFKDKNAAIEAYKAFEDQKKEFSLVFESDSFKKITLSNPGAGYFSRIDGIYLQTYVVSYS